MTRYSAGFLLALGLIIIVIVLIIRSLTSGPSGPRPLDLNSYSSSDVSVRFTIDSPVAASSKHNDISITINNSAATLVITQGYDGETINTKSYQMSVSAYAVFLHALTLNGFNKGDNSPNSRDERGQCALEDRFIYEVVDNTGNDLQRYWYTSCNTGTFGGSPTVIRTLFIAQIPDYDRLTSNIAL